MKEPTTKQCEYCGAEFVATHGNKRICPVCSGVSTEKGERMSASVFGNRSYLNQNQYELHIKLAAIERAKHNDDIIAEGYAERQIEKTLSMVEPIKTDL